MSRGPLFLGDVGHSVGRLTRARATARSLGFDVKEVLYPGFEGRPAAATEDEFFSAVELQVDVYRLSHARPLIYATGFGALVVLALRARALAPDLPAILQGPVPWTQTADERPGIESLAAFGDDAQKEAFATEHFLSPLDAAERRSFFTGYATCTARDDIARWFDRDGLQRLAHRLAARPQAVDGVRVWYPGQDDVGIDDDHDDVVRTLGAEWPTERVEHWGRYPYLDAPGPWLGALQAAGV